MDVGDGIALGAAVVAVVAAVIAAAQAKSARSQARSARSQAESAEVSANAASRQAVAAEGQLLLMRQQIAIDTAARDEAEGPRFVPQTAEWYMSGERFATVSLVVEGGPLLSSVTVRPRGDTMRGFKSTSRDQGPTQEQIFPHVAAGSLIELAVELHWDLSEPVNLTFELTCVEQGRAERTWVRTCTAVAKERPEPNAFGRFRSTNR